MVRDAKSSTQAMPGGNKTNGNITSGQVSLQFGIKSMAHFAVNKIRLFNNINKYKVELDWP